MSSQSQLRQRGGKSNDEAPSTLKEISRQNTSKAVGRGPSVILSLITVLTLSYVGLQLYAFLSGQSALQVILPPSMSGRFNPNSPGIDSDSLSQKYLYNPFKKAVFGQVEKQEQSDQSFQVEVDGRKAEIRIDGKAENEKEAELGEDLATKAAKLLLDNDGMEGDVGESAELRDDAK